MTKTILAALVLVGCGGESFTAFEQSDEGGVDVGSIETGTGGNAGDGGSALASGGLSGSDGSPGTGGSAYSTGGAVGSSGGASGSTGGAAGSGGTSTGGSLSTGGAPNTGGAQPDTGGTTATGGSVSSTGGSVTCTTVTHSNGLGQTWQDCVPLGTYDQTQATKACAAAFGSACYLNSPDISCQQVGSMNATIGGQVHAWVYLAPDVAGARPGDLVEFTSGEFKCPNWPIVGSWK